MAGLVSKIKEKVHRRSDSTASGGLLVTEGNETAGQAAMNGMPGSPNSGRSYHTPPRVSVDNSAFHVSRGNPRKSIDVPQNYSHPLRPDTHTTTHTTTTTTTHTIGQPRQKPRLEERQAAVDDKVPERGSSMNSPISPRGGLQDRNSRNISMGEQQAVAGGIVPDRDSSKRASKKDFDRSHLQGGWLEDELGRLDGGRSAERSPTHALDNNNTRGRGPSMDGHPDSNAGASIRMIPGNDESRSSHNSGGNNLNGRDPAQAAAAVPIPPRKDSLSQPVKRKPFSPSPTQNSPAASSPLNTHFGHSAAGRDISNDQHSDSSSDYDESRPLHEPRAKKILHKQGYAERAKEEVVKDKATNLTSEHLRLPEGFDLRNTEMTDVTEEWKPAVTRETIIRERTEIIQEAISRDIHIHHYYIYEQPIKVVEALPAKHYYLDVKTGVKTEIQQPLGWTMPENVVPGRADVSTLKGFTRHYVVDEEHPRGAPEAAPQKYEQGHQGLR